MLTRRDVVGGALAAGAARAAFGADEAKAAIRRTVPSSGESLPVIGLGTSRTFDLDPAARAPLAGVVTEFLGAFSLKIAAIRARFVVPVPP